MMELGGEGTWLDLKKSNNNMIMFLQTCVVLVSHDHVIMHSVMRSVEVASLISSPSVGTRVTLTQVPTLLTLFLHIPAPSGIRSLFPQSPPPILLSPKISNCIRPSPLQRDVGGS